MQLMDFCREVSGFIVQSKDVGRLRSRAAGCGVILQNRNSRGQAIFVKCKEGTSIMSWDLTSNIQKLLYYLN